MRITVPPHLAGRLAPHNGRRATLGIRPENLAIADGATPAGQTFEAVVEVAEQLGSEVLLDLKAGPASIVASVEPTVRVKPGEKIRLAMKPERIHFFDGETELAI
jgi:multiple sugar transport system ATP-binding protein